LNFDVDYQGEYMVHKEIYIELQDTQWQFDYIDHDRNIARAIVYDENGILCAINRVPLETTGNTSVSVDKNDNAEKAKIFVFSRTLQPIITSEEFPLI